MIKGTGLMQTNVSEEKLQNFYFKMFFKFFI